MSLRAALTSLLALLSTVAAFAQEGTQDFANLTLSTRSRDEIRRELAEARAAGQWENRGETYGGFARGEVASTRARTEVVAELDAARRAGELENRGETYGSFARDTTFSARARAKVRAELAEAQAIRVQLSRGNRSHAR